MSGLDRQRERITSTGGRHTGCTSAVGRSATDLRPTQRDPSPSVSASHWLCIASQALLGKLGSRPIGFSVTAARRSGAPNLNCRSTACELYNHWTRLSGQQPRPYLAPLLRYSDLLAKIANFPCPLSFSALVRGDSLRIYGKALRFLKLESFRQPTVKIW